MIFRIDRRHNNQEIRVPIETRKPSRIVVKVRHPKKPSTYYFDTAPVISGQDMFRIKIPKMPPSVILEVYNEENGNLQFDPTFRIGNIKSVPITQAFSITKVMDANVASFMNFSDDFAENAALISAENSIYRSPDGKFRIDYKDVIRDDSGNPLKTPARVNSKTKVIEISKKYYIRLTVPARKWTNYHEFAHVWLNKNPSDELEADKNAIMIYLGTGNPVIEAYNGIYNIFKNTPSNQNKARYEALDKYIKNFGSIMNRGINQKQPQR